MSGRYERVNDRDVEDPDTPAFGGPRPINPVPNSPPPSFHSRASSRAPGRQNEQVNQDLADAFDTDGDDSEDEADDRQRLVRNNGASTEHASARPVPERAVTQLPPVSAPAGGPATPFRVYGSGVQSDGVFSNMAAKPETGEEKEEMPPTYEQAAADAAPPYWETTILAPGFIGTDDVYIDGMPVGSFFSFVWNGMISMAFQVPGFLLTYLLHSTHAAKNGSLAGLGITLIQFGFLSRGPSDSGGGGSGGNANGMGGSGEGGYANPPDPNSHDFDPHVVGTEGGDESGGLGGISGGEWLGYVLMIAGWFILIRAVTNMLRVRRHEELVLRSPDRGLGVPIIAEGESSERVV